MVVIPPPELHWTRSLVRFCVCKRFLHSNVYEHVNHHHHYQSHQLVCRTATKLLHPCLSLASLWMVPQLWFIFFSSASTVLHQVVFSRPHFCFPSGVQWIATLVRELASLCSRYPILVQNVPNPCTECAQSLYRMCPILIQNVPNPCTACAQSSAFASC